ncbi:hypothetical protein [Chitinophaga caseinilytica]|uniref:hypothetical protein n=1 Tax=Chitinophaga caseinilytica TaxID=2267521 RepID=UPI003C308DEF
MNGSFCCIGFQQKYFGPFFRYITAKLIIMFAEKIEVPGLRPGPALRKRRLTNLLSRIKIGMFGVESLRPEFVEGKDVRALNTRLVEELMRRMFSQRYALIEKVYQSDREPLRFFLLLKEDRHDAWICVRSLLSEYGLLDVSERYPVWFDYIPGDRKQKFLTLQMPEFQIIRDEQTHSTGEAQFAVA